jgi:molybdopterin/thiamine biosynthesis adenylyltransferase
LHPLESVVVIAIMAVLAGANGPTAIAKWAKIKAEVLLKWLDLPHGIPRKDVFCRVLATLKPDAFQACFTMWLTALRAAAAAAIFVVVDCNLASAASNRRIGYRTLILA